MKLYIAVLDEVPDHMVPVLVAHTMLGAHLFFYNFYNHGSINYTCWLEDSFKKCVVRVNIKEFNKIANIPFTHLGHENTVLGGMKCCAIPLPTPNTELPNVLKFAKLWGPNV
jgi:hypothetical protein